MVSLSLLNVRKPVLITLVARKAKGEDDGGEGSGDDSPSKKVKTDEEEDGECGTFF